MTTVGPRQRLLTSAAVLMCERGVHATGVAELLAHSGTARGSLYQYFPGGKTELMEATTRWAGSVIGDVFAELLSGHDAADAVTGMAGYWRRVLAESDYTRGCPVLAAAGAGPDEPALAAAAEEVFESWRRRFAARLVADGADATSAEQLASVCISTLEGAIAQARAARDTAALDAAGAVLAPLCRAAVRTSVT
ncbi:TetR/AcrR family transcriptional regulator [Tsukamurella sp. 8F]|uniref:TetR/AcrR family transcriptional regulator n=1 Tax=unclassified Tsukamurella TaxID=2633480 RepID=UPI0023B99D85|nr:MULTISPECIES: TetR/AcrR family transcriptional regulator [unclassified Tsukamurella]MDF0529561.1 TetR/AcrR family transcriptional regulator [Tsukamurella sp. 8J]MDF0585751.1 TetR/AcrR family transcriptional regulator [Tsukamurella sp. 8F]